MTPKKMIYQLKITLCDTKPPIWRRLQIPTSATFWDLHLAIQSVFQWNHTHLHQFLYDDKVVDKHHKFGIPFEEDETYGMEVFSSWKHKISKYLNLEEPFIKYVYDLGDKWLHTIQLEALLPAEEDVIYPRCMKGSRNSPPDDCGGIRGYAAMLEVLADPAHEDYESRKVWVESMKGGPFDPEHFDPKMVIFEDPRERFKDCQVSTF